jgi:adenine-specific DNA-methyltransferase
MSERQATLELQDRNRLESVDEYRFEQPPIRGYPELRWNGKRPFISTQYYPAQLKETHGPEVERWRNKIYWGDNLQVMSHLLKEYRGQVQLVYIDPPFDSKADYRKQIKLRGRPISGDESTFEEKQYSDIWTNDEYLQFMFERLILLRELMDEVALIYLHCDWHQGHYLRCIADEVFGKNQFLNDVVWQRTGAHNDAGKFGIVHDYLLIYAKGNKWIHHPTYVPHGDEHLRTRFNLLEEGTNRRFFAGPITAPGSGPSRIFDGREIEPPPGRHWSYSQENLQELIEQNRIYYSSTGTPYLKQYMDEYVEQGRRIQSIWTDILPSKTGAELTGYPTQKPEKLLERIIRASSNPGDLVFDCFMGSGTTQAVAMKLGRRFIGADINLGAVQITTKRLLGLAKELEMQPVKEPAQTVLLDDMDEEEETSIATEPTVFYTGFEVYNVNHYDVFRNPVQARDLLLEALEVNRLGPGHVFDGEKDGRMWKLMPVNRIATRADLNDLLSNLDYRAFERRQAEQPNKPVEKITLVCMGHEADLGAVLKREVEQNGYRIDVDVVDILRDKQELQFKRDAEARVMAQDGRLVIEAFYPMNLLSKLSLQAESVEEWRELVESVMIDWNYDGAVLQPALVDIPEGNALVQGAYSIPNDAGTIRVKITDLLSESLEMEIAYG